MKAIILASLMALSAVSFEGCGSGTKVADKNKNISSSYGGGYFYISGGQIHVRNNSWIGTCDVSYLYSDGLYEFTYGGTEWAIGYVNGTWQVA